MDRRQQRSRQAIFQAFRGLLNQKPYPSITVREIIDDANVGRSTFYAHFETKDELLRQMCEELFDHVFRETVAEEETHDYSSGNGSIEGEIAHVLWHIKDDRELALLMASDNADVFTQYFERHLLDSLIPQIIKANGLSHKAPKEMREACICSMFSGCVRWWIGCDFGQPPNTIAHWLMHMLEAA